MTAEIAILNRSAVALAADSAVTLQTTGGAPKIYNTNKLFTLSKFQPVGIMVYGNAQFMDMPWETTVKAYRSHLGKRAFPSVTAYATDFLRFIERNSVFFPRDRQESHVYDFVAGWLQRLKHHLQVEATPALRRGAISQGRLRSLFRQVVEREISHLANHQVLPKFRRISAVSILRQYRGIIQQAIQDELRELASGSLISSIERSAAEVLIKDVYWENATGVVVAGFGSSQFFPSMRSYELSSIIGGQLRSREDRKADITFKQTAVFMLLPKRRWSVSLWMELIVTILISQ